MADDSKGKVLTFEPGRVDLSIERYSAEEERECRHGDFRISPRKRWVRCGACRERLDPFDVLLRYAERDDRLYQRDEAAKGVTGLLAWFHHRDLKINFDDMTASAVGKTGQRIETGAASHRRAGGGVLGSVEGLLMELKQRLEKWTERELVYPRFTVTRRSAKRYPDGHIEVGVLWADGRWSRIADVKSEREAHEAIRKTIAERELEQWAMEDRPRKLWWLRRL